jgi:predicted MFS family arabinose efflux permease
VHVGKSFAQKLGDLSGAPTLLQKAIADTAGDGADVAQSMLALSSIWQWPEVALLVAGGLLLEHAGPSSFPPTLLILALLGLSVVWLARAKGFKPGHRAIMQ